MKVIQDNFQYYMEVLQRIKSFCSNISDDAAAGAGTAINLEKCMQDNAVMNRMISLRTIMMEQDLGIGKGLHADKIATHEALHCNYLCRR